MTAPRPRVVGLGQRAAGDDGAGLAVVERLRSSAAARGIEILEAREASALVEWVQTAAPVVVVDALLGAAPGEVVELEPEALDARGLSALSTHGVGVGAAVALARAVAPDAVSPRIRVLGIGIAAARRGVVGLSPEVERGVARAVERVLELLAG